MQLTYKEVQLLGLVQVLLHQSLLVISRPWLLQDQVLIQHFITVVLMALRAITPLELLLKKLP